MPSVIFLKGFQILYQMHIDLKGITCLSWPLNARTSDMQASTLNAIPESTCIGNASAAALNHNVHSQEWRHTHTQIHMSQPQHTFSTLQISSFEVFVFGNEFVSEKLGKTPVMFPPLPRSPAGALPAFSSIHGTRPARTQTDSHQTLSNWK